MKNPTISRDLFFPLRAEGDFYSFHIKCTYPKDAVVNTKHSEKGIPSQQGRYEGGEGTGKLYKIKLLLSYYTWNEQY